MSDASGPESSRVERLRHVAAELGRMLQLRRELAELEIRHDYRNVRRLALVGGLGISLFLIGLPLLLSSSAHYLANVTSVNVTQWMLILGLAAMIPGGWIGLLAVRRFKSEFCGLKNTLAELNEDLVWLREWTDRAGSETNEIESQP